MNIVESGILQQGNAFEHWFMKIILPWYLSASHQTASTFWHGLLTRAFDYGTISRGVVSKLIRAISTRSLAWVVLLAHVATRLL
jgi:hypothetical protein